MKQTLILAMTAAVMLLSGCAGGPGAGEESGEASIAPGGGVPVAVVVERIIEGEILTKRLKEPVGLAVDFRGVVFVSDAGNHRIIRFNELLDAETEVGGFGSGEGGLDSPSFLMVDNSLNLVVSDVGNRRLARFDNRLHYAGEIKLIDDEDALKYGRPSGLAITDYGEMWYADHEKGCLVVFDNIGQFEKYVGDFGYTGGQLSQPEELVYERLRQQFLVCDAGNGRIIAYDDFGNFEYRFSTGSIEYPIATADGGDSRLWILDGVSGRLGLFDREGGSLFETGPMLAGDDRALSNPSDIALLPDGRLIISDTGNNRLVVCRPFYPE
jgi:sugar lactone lactonase YvrE